MSSEGDYGNPWGTDYHVPVMAREVVRLMADAPPGPIVDGTLGGGGHTAALLAAKPERQVIGVDQDPDALAEAARRLGPDANARFVRGNFGDLKTLLEGALGPEPRVAGILLDLGVSSWQLDDAARGFAFKHGEAPLDMRMDQTDTSKETAHALIGRLDVNALARLLRELGEVRSAMLLARRIKAAHDGGGLNTTSDLARVVESVQKKTRKGAPKKTHPATVVFQALRIAVNQELAVLDTILDQAPDLLADGGILAVMSYHSLEDRRVKQRFVLGERGPKRPGHLPPPSDWQPTWQVLTRKSLTAEPDEVAANPRARSARLRVAARAPRSNAPFIGGRR